MKLRENWIAKVAAFVLAVAAFVVAAITGWYQLVNFDVLWGEMTPAEGYTVRYLESEDSYYLADLVGYYEAEAAGVSLNAYGLQDMARLEEKFDADNTNLRWQALSGTGQVIYGNTDEKVSGTAWGVFWRSFALPSYISDLAEITAVWRHQASQDLNLSTAEVENVVTSSQWREELSAAYARAVSGQTLSQEELTRVYLDESGTGELMCIWLDNEVCMTGSEYWVYGPSVQNMLEGNRFGYRYTLDEGWVATEAVFTSSTQQLVLWLDDPLQINDKYQQAYATLDNWKSTRAVRMTVTLVCAGVGLLLTLYLCAAAGHKRERERIVLNWFHRIPSDLLLGGMALAFLFVGSIVVEELLYRSYYADMPMFGLLLAVGLMMAFCAGLVIAGAMTVSARCKTHTLLYNTLIRRFCHWGWRLCRDVVLAVPLVWKALAVGLGYLMTTILFFNNSGVLWLLVSGGMIALLCLWAAQWKKVRRGAQEIIGGNPDYHIDTRWMLPDLKKHADELNSLGQTISAAVEDRMKSEHFKAELITNVSHDLKTPLTSIINYVDLLKKEPIDDPKIAEYIEVLDRKSQRLKKLTEDLVEASKASTGSLTVIRERIGLTQLADQALAEYEERLEAKGLSVVRTFPEGEVWVEADGRHLWRVLDNLLSNCAKYAMEGTRIYLEVQRGQTQATLAIKNISREPLNVPPEALMERFVRGEESRTTEGSGLGLSIAQSLTDLQKGRFQLSIDGDLFKAVVILPLAEEE